MSMYDDMRKRPVALVFAGPDGSGKSTVTRGLSPTGTCVNADNLKNEYGLTDQEAAKQAAAILRALLDQGADFSFETALSAERDLSPLQEAQNLGYEVQCIYALTCNESINIARVRARAAAGGSNKPEEKIRARYHRALALLPRLVAVCDKILVYDNSELPVLICSKENAYLEIFPNAYWTKIRLRKLIGA